MFAWPERIVGFLFLLEIIILALFALSAPTAGTAGWFIAMGWLWHFPAFTLIPIWIILRAIDLLFAGPARRREHIMAKFSP